MQRTRAERRYKTALIKKKILSRDKFGWVTETEYFFKDYYKGCVVLKKHMRTKEEIKDGYRIAFRNEGKWRHPGTKRFEGCGPDCWYCNPQARCEWRESVMKSDCFKMDSAEFEEVMSGGVASIV